MKATLKFQTRSDAENFATAWGRYSKTGHTIGSGMINVSVIIYDLSNKDKEWVNSYVSELNK